MTRARLVAGASLAICLAQVSLAAADPPRLQRFPAVGSIETAFTPGDAIDNLIVGAVDAARSEVLVQAYSFTHRRIAGALVRARERGVAVAVLADLEQARALPQNALPGLAAAGVDVCLDGNFQAAHNKIIVIDADTPRATTITGSYNFTYAAQRSNAENIVVLRDNPPVARAYRTNWMRLKSACVPLSKDSQADGGHAAPVKQ
jgi:phosphatidylserine/phosphatidylglycerophosphate/cardiolipin synthase-like enzyme